MTRTKIICTIGPSVNSVEKVLELINAGMNVARLNFSHGSHEEHVKSIEMIKEARKKAQKPIAIMLDTKGPEIRLGKVCKQGIKVQPGKKIWLVKEELEAKDDKITVRPSFVLEKLPVGTSVLIDNGYIASHVVEVSDAGVCIEFVNNGTIFSSKGVNIPNMDLGLPALTEKDAADIAFGCNADIDIIAASFIRCPDHVLAIKKLIIENKKPETLILAKIENTQGVENFDAILQVADGIMIARGDLGVEVPLSQVPRLQKMMIRKCYMEGKPSITATQMLESMINNPRPTRAEASDVANAIYDGTSCVMLSGETAVGKYPIETVKTMKSIAKEAEQDFDYMTFFDHHTKMVSHDVPSAVTLASVKTAYSLGAKAIFAFTLGGSTAELISRLRPQMPVIALTSNEKTYQQLSLNWGVIPLLSDECKDVEQAFKKTSDFALKNTLLTWGDLVVMTSGSPFWVSGTTNTIRVENIGDVLVRSHVGYGVTVHGNISLIRTPESKQPKDVKGKIIVIPSCDEAFTPFIEEAAGIILQNPLDDITSEKRLKKLAKELGKSAVVRADNAFKYLREDQLVTLHPEKALIYKGIID